MKKKIEEKILFLESVLKEVQKDYNAIERTTVDIENDYGIEKLIYTSQIKILKQILKESQQ